MERLEKLANRISNYVIAYRIPCKDDVFEFIKILENISSNDIPTNPSLVMLYGDLLNVEGGMAFQLLKNRSEYFMFLTYHIRKLIESLINPKINKQEAIRTFWKFFIHTSLNDPSYYPEGYEDEYN